ncbi:MAG: hypothetical protein H0W88_09925 [Parachlamydiaceae bacterium]|nr:hypothetical protein [Parachlamydiaceae bacterium]
MSSSISPQLSLYESKTEATSTGDQTRRKRVSGKIQDLPSPIMTQILSFLEQKDFGTARTISHSLREHSYERWLMHNTIMDDGRLSVFKLFAKDSDSSYYGLPQHVFSREFQTRGIGPEILTNLSRFRELRCQEYSVGSIDSDIGNVLKDQNLPLVKKVTLLSEVFGEVFGEALRNTAQSCPNLRQVTVNRINNAGIKILVENCSHLTSLGIQYFDLGFKEEGLTEECLSGLNRSKITHVSCSITTLSPETDLAFTKINALRQLSLYSKKFNTNVNLAFLSECLQLQTLYLGAGFTDEMIKPALKDLSRLTSLQISENRDLTGSILQYMPRLQTLNMNRWHLSQPPKGAISRFDALLHCQDLQHLEVDAMKFLVKRRELKIICQLPKLRTLKLKDTELTDSDLFEIRSCKKLEVLDLDQKFVEMRLTLTAVGVFKVASTCLALKRLILKDFPMTKVEFDYLNSVSTSLHIELPKNRSRRNETRKSTMGKCNVM